MQRLLLVLIFSFASLVPFSASAVDILIFDETAIGFAQSNSDSSITAPTSFSARLNAAALEQEEVVFNLPHKQMSAVRKPQVGDIGDQITPYAFKGRKGFVAINSKNTILESVVIFDQEESEVYRGTALPDGSLEFEQVNIDEFICVNYENTNAASSPSTANISFYQSLNNLTLQQVTSLQSRPGASKVLYIDYLAGTVSGTAWNTGEGAPATVVYDNYSYDGDASTFSLIDLQSMYAGWAETAEDYAPFDVNVTTDLAVYNSVAHVNKSKIVATSTNWFGGGGVAYVGIFGLRNDDFYNIGWTFNSGFGSMGMTNAHESGHQMGLSHDGTSAVTYYSGAGNSGPIMGAPFGKDFVHWNNGSYPDANQTQNDLSIIQGRLGLISDDHGDSNGASTTITTQEIIGFINPQGLSADVDVFRFTLGSTQTVNIDVRSLFAQANNSGGDNTAGGLNLSAKIELRNSSGGLVQQKLPSSNAAANDFNFSGNLSSGVYYLSIEPQAYANANFNEYGNGGYYQILNNIQFAPDLIVDSASSNDSSLSPGQVFQLTASVKNQGNAASSTTTLTYYRSSDSTITTGDTNVGSDSVAALNPDVSGSENINLTAPSSSGDYYYGACVTSVANEEETSNNCSAAVLINVDSNADLIVETPTVNDSTLDSDQPFTLSASVKNQGNAPSAATTLTYFRSINSTISTSDTNLGTDNVSGLNPEASSAESINLVAPSSPGTYYYGACVTSVVNETETTNNCSSAVLVTVASNIDLIVEVPSVNDSTPDSGQSFTFSASVKNQGNTASTASTLIYYRSINSTISNSDTNVGSESVAGLAANASSAENISLTAPNAPGSYYYGACVSVVNGESNTSNNCSAGVLITVTPTIDLIVESPAVTDNSVDPAQAFSFSTLVRNQGNSNSPPATLTYYRSINSAISPSDTNVGSDNVGSLGAGASSSESISLTAPTNAGNYYYGACVNAVDGETSSANNCSIGVLVNVASTIDLVVEPATANESTLDSAQSFNLSASVRNLGNSSSEATTMNYYRSVDASISPSDINVGSDAISALAANALSPQNIGLIAPIDSGNYYYGACVNAVSGESNTSNNCSESVLVRVLPTIDPDPYEPNNDSGTAKAITNGEIQSHTLHEVDDQDWLAFTLAEPAENMVIETSGSGSDDTRMWLYDGSLNELAFSDDDGDGSYSKINVDTPLPAGTYYVLVDEFENNDLIESYTITLNFDSNLPKDDSICLPIKSSNEKMAVICL